MLKRLAAMAAIVLAGGIAGAQAQTPIKLGVLSDMSGTFSGWSGKGSVLAAELAVEDFKKLSGKPDLKVDIVSADHQNKTDVASAITRQWVSEGVGVVLDVPNSAAALAVNEITRGTKTAFITAGGATDDLVGKACSPNTVQWTLSAWSLGYAASKVAIAQGGDSWFFITSDYVGGYGLEKSATAFVQQAGGHVLGHALPALGTLDFSSYVLQAQASKAKIIGLASGGNDLMNMIKQAGEYGLVDQGQKLVPVSMFIQDIHGLGLKAAHGLVFAVAFYWDMNDNTRAFSKRFMARNGGVPPSHVQAGVYSSTFNYLRAATDIGSTDGAAVVRRLKETPTDDMLYGKGSVRADGRMLHDWYVVEVKTPAESKGPWDYYKVLATLPAKESFNAISPDCAMLK